MVGRDQTRRREDDRGSTARQPIVSYPVLDLSGASIDRDGPLRTTIDCNALPEGGIYPTSYVDDITMLVTSTDKRTCVVHWPAPLISMSICQNDR